MHIRYHLAYTRKFLLESTRYSPGYQSDHGQPSSNWCRADQWRSHVRATFEFLITLGKHDIHYCFPSSGHQLGELRGRTGYGRRFADGKFPIQLEHPAARCNHLPFGSQGKWLGNVRGGCVPVAPAKGTRNRLSCNTIAWTVRRRRSLLPVKRKQSRQRERLSVRRSEFQDSLQLVAPKQAVFLHRQELVSLLCEAHIDGVEFIGAFDWG